MLRVCEEQQGGQLAEVRLGSSKDEGRGCPMRQAVLRTLTVGFEQKSDVVKRF